MKTVLIIDDEKELTDYLAKFIERMGFKVWTAQTGEEGLELYKANRADCVFLDVHLPAMDGITVLKKIKEVGPEANVYLVTGDEGAALKSAGATGYILKPLDIRNVVKILENL